jgi:carboxyl-terminal processing protease
MKGKNMSVLKRDIGLITSGVLLGATLVFGQMVFAEKEPAKPDLPLEELRTFSEIFGRIKSSYVEPVEDKVLIENAIRGMLSGLDPHSTYLDLEDFQELREGTSGEFGGLGIEVSMEDGFVKVVTPIDDTPAAEPLSVRGCERAQECVSHTGTYLEVNVPKDKKLSASDLLREWV